MKRRLTAMMVLVTTTAVLVACGSPNPEDTRPTPDGQPTATKTAETAVWPLTGKPAKNGVVKRVPLIVKIDNSAGAQPQVGLADADLVVEELVEGGLTRLAAMYHSTLPESVGPVRSIRTTDVGIVKPTGGALVASGGAGRVLDQMDDAGVAVIAEGDADGFSRATDRTAPYNVMADLTTVSKATANARQPADAYLPFDDNRLEGKNAATFATATFSNTHATTWEYNGEVWKRGNGLAASGDQFAAKSLLVLRVKTRDAGYTDPGGNFVPETVLKGNGNAALLTGGKAITGRWAKSSAQETFELTDKNGEPLTVPAGRTWIELLPVDGSLSYS